MRVVVIAALLTLTLTACGNKTTDVKKFTYETLETIDVSQNVSATSQSTEDADTLDRTPVRREPDVDLPDVDGFNKDEFGNYIISEENFKSGNLPLNSDGIIQYIYWYDKNDIVVNPMPEYYYNYQEYFNIIGG